MTVETGLDLSQENLHVTTSGDAGTTVGDLVVNGTAYTPPSECAPFYGGQPQYCTFSTTGYTPVYVFGVRCQQEDYFYDSNPFSSTYSSNVLGRLAAVRYWGGPCGTSDELTFE